MRELIAQAEALDKLCRHPFSATARANDVLDVAQRMKMELRAQAEQPAEQGTLQAGMNNAELLAAWMKKLPGTEPSKRDLRAFAVGAEVGFDRARALEKADWMRIHYVLKDAGIHPGRTDDHLADVIARALKPAEQGEPVAHGFAPNGDGKITDALVVGHNDDPEYNIPLYRIPDPRLAALEGLLQEIAADKCSQGWHERIEAALGKEG